MSQPSPTTSTIKVDAAGVAVLITLTAAAFGIGIKPILDHRAQNKANRLELVGKHDQATRVGNTLTNARGLIGQIRRMTRQSNVQLQPATHLNQRLAQITDLATESQLDVGEIQPGGVAKGERYVTVPIQLSGTGSYRMCASFLHQLRQAFPDTGVSAFQITGRPQFPDEPAAFRFSLDWYASPSLASVEP